MVVHAGDRAPGRIGHRRERGGVGDPVDAAILQADHPEYAELTPADLPGIAVLVDGRNATRPANWAGVTRLVVGKGF